ncbi:MAG: orotidine-5'-phosphate decarboxylase [Limnochordia bacterium]|nr:orotidine-5'-phosphate decarboxylase [Limnochordia bacterium]
MISFSDRLDQKITEKQSHVVVGLDPRWHLIPEYLKQEATKQFGQGPEAIKEVLFQFGLGIMEAVAEYAVAIKPQFAFFEQFGPWGMLALQELVLEAGKLGLLVIGDGKRNDIGSTAEAYANAYLGKVDIFEQKTQVWSMDALTVNAYLGVDGVRPFINVAKEHGNGLFVLLRTSNPSASDFQDLTCAKGKAYEAVAAKVAEWVVGEEMGQCGYSFIGVVVGATYPDDAKRLRELLPHCIFLVPGYGAQGAGALEVLPCFDENGKGAVVNSARDIIFAYTKPAYAEYGERNFADAARQAAKTMRDDLLRVVG